MRPLAEAARERRDVVTGVGGAVRFQMAEQDRLEHDDDAHAIAEPRGGFKRDQAAKGVSHERDRRGRQRGGRNDKLGLIRGLIGRAAGQGLVLP